MANKAFTLFKKLRAEIQDLGVGIGAASNQRITQLRQGVELNRNEPFCTKSGIYDVLHDGSVMHCYVHIPHRDLNSRDQGVDPSSPQNWHRYHLLWCDACKSHPHKMRKFTSKEGTFNYSVSVDGSPYRSDLDDGGRDLILCQFCETKLSELGIMSAGEPTDLAAFLNRDLNSLNLEWVSPIGEFDKIPNIYSEDWPLISKSLKSKRQWQCERCRIDLRAKDCRHFLHAHHRDNLKQNNSIFNLEALCIRCHAKEHPHNELLNNSPNLVAFNLKFKDPDAGKQKASEYLLRRNIDRVFHFTDTRNLKNIKKHGLLSKKFIDHKKLVVITGGNKQSLNDDRKLGLDCYIHLSLSDNHPMEYRAKERGSIQESVYLEIDVRALDVEGCETCKVVATAANAERLPINDGLPGLDLDILQSLNPDFKDPRYQNARKSELMIPDHIPTSMILNLD